MKAIDDRRLSFIKFIESEAGRTVEKTFVSRESCEREANVYRLIGGTGLKSAKLLEQREKQLILSFLEGEDYASLLARQEKEGLDQRPWDSLLAWTVSFYRITGLIQNDMNLRNFLCCEGEAAGIDFEDCRRGEPAEMLAELAAFVRLYEPAETANKKRIAARIRETALQERYCTGEQFDEWMESRTAQLRERRKMKKHRSGN